MDCAAIFDVDGTLVDSRKIIHDAMQRAFAVHDLDPPSYDQTRRIVGLTLSVAIDRLAPRHVGAKGIEAMTQSYKDEFVKLRQHSADLEPLYAGAQDLLERLKAQGWALGIATGKSRRGLDMLMKKCDWGSLFDAHFCSDDGPGKPDPHMVNANLMKLGMQPSQAVVIGDTSFDMIMSKSAGVHAIGVNWGFHTEPEILGGGADEIASTMDGLGAALDNFARLVEAA